MHGLSRWLLIAAACLCSISAWKIPHKKLEGLERLKMNMEEFNKVEKLHLGWYNEALTALLGAMAKNMYRDMERSEKKALVACLDSIEKEGDLKSGAKCLTKAFDQKLLEHYGYSSNEPKYDFIGREEKQTRVRDDDIEEEEKVRMLGRKINTNSEEVFANAAIPSSTEKSMTRGRLNIRKLPAKNVPKQKKTKKVKRTKKRKTTTTTTTTTSTTTSTTPSPKRKQNQAQRMRIAKRKMIKLNDRMRNVMIENEHMRMYLRHRVKRHSLYSDPEAAKYAKEAEDMERPKIKSMAFLPELKGQVNSPIKKVTNLIRTVVEPLFGNSTANLKVSYKQLEEIQSTMKERRETQKYQKRMLDTVLGDKNVLRKRRDFSERFKDLLNEKDLPDGLFDLVNTVAKHNHHNNPSVKFLSPRFAPLVPDDDEKTKIISPNIFPMFKDDNGILPIPEVLEKAGLPKSDREEILQLVMDASGANDILDEAVGILKKAHEFDLDKDIMDITHAIAKSFKLLEQTFDPKQKAELETNSFTFMKPDQLKQLFQDGGPTNVTGFPFDVDEYGRLTDEERHESLRLKVREIAGEYKAPTTIEGNHLRVKRTLTPNYLNPTVFGPAIFGPGIWTFSCLSPVVISPSVFSPAIVNPLLMSPPVISPQVGNPMILSPYVLGPNVLSAAVFNAYVLTPYVLSPNVINPYVMSPLILSPFVLSPDALSPTILSGGILSPSVLSPAIFTESALAADVLSPSFLS